MHRANPGRQHPPLAKPPLYCTSPLAVTVTPGGQTTRPEREKKQRETGRQVGGEWNRGGSEHPSLPTMPSSEKL